MKDNFPMAEKRIAKIVVGLPVEGPFDYFIGDEFLGQVSPGKRVRVMFNQHKAVGYVVAVEEKSAFKDLNRILGVLEDHPSLDTQALKLVEALSAYYGCSLGQAIEAYLPSLLRKDLFTNLPPVVESIPQNNLTTPSLLIASSPDERWALLQPRLRSVLEKGEQVIVLVPQAELLAGLLKRIQTAFGFEPLVFDKRMKPKEELESWIKSKSAQARVIVGTRSTVFAPVPRLGMIVIMDEENPAYKQEQIPHYHAVNVAHMRAQLSGCAVVCMSAFASVETWHQAKKEKWVVEQAQVKTEAAVQLIDLNNYNPKKTSIVSPPLMSAIEHTLKGKGKAILYFNRKHFEPKDDEPKSKRMDVERVELTLRKFFPSARVATYVKESGKFPSADVVVATAAMMKLRESLKVELIGVLAFDEEISHFDFRSTARAMTLVKHLQSMATSKVVVQTRLIDNPYVKAVKSHQPALFYRQELKVRKELHLPPFSHIVHVMVRGDNEAAVINQSQEIFQAFSHAKAKSIETFEPQIDVVKTKRIQFQNTIILKGKNAALILALVRKVLSKHKKRKKVIIAVNVDP